jgi:2-iminobutanoate/2-iminopropanoate deaminase
MKPEAIQPDGVVRPRAPYSPVVVSGEHVFTAGQVGFDLDGEVVAGGVGAQTRRALDNLRACLEAAGSDLEHIVKVTAFLVDLGDFEAYNEVYREYFSEPYPARTTVGAALPGELRVEIEAIARLRE